MWRLASARGGNKCIVEKAQKRVLVMSLLVCVDADFDNALDILFHSLHAWFQQLCHMLHLKTIPLCYVCLSLMPHTHTINPDIAVQESSPDLIPLQSFSDPRIPQKQISGVPISGVPPHTSTALVYTTKSYTSFRSHIINFIAADHAAHHTLTMPIV